MTRCATTARSSSSRSSSSSLQPRWKEAACRAAKSAASRGVASDTRGCGRANSLARKPIIGAAACRRAVAGRRGRADRAVSAGPRPARRRRPAARSRRCRARGAGPPPPAAARPRGHARGHQLGPRAHDPGRSAGGGPRGLAQRHHARRQQAASTRAEHLHVDVVVPGIDRHHDRRVAFIGDMRGRQARQGGEADGGLGRRQGDAAGGRDADPQAGEAAGPDRDRDAVELAELDLGLVHHPRDQRHQGFGMAARHDAALAGDDGAGIAVEHGGRAGIQRAVDGKDTHSDSGLARGLRRQSSRCRLKRRQASATLPPYRLRPG